MKYGNIDAYIDGEWKVVEDSGELTTPVTSYTFSDLNGDVDIEYHLIYRLIGGFELTTYTLRYNGDSGSNYGRQVMYSFGASVGAGQSTETSHTIGYAAGSGNVTFGDMKIYAKSGINRTALGKQMRSVNGTAIAEMDIFGWCWANLSDNITEISVTADKTDGFATGSRIILLKKVHCHDAMKMGETFPDHMKGVWERIFSTDTHSIPYAQYKMSESEANTTVIDSGGGENNGTANTNTVNLAADAGGKAANGVFDTTCANFNDTNNYISIPNSPDFDILTKTNFTYDFWCKLNDGGAAPSYLLAQVEDGNNNFYLPMDGDAGGGTRFVVWSNGTLVGNLNSWGDRIQDKKWHHVALCKIGTEWGMFLDGRQISYNASMGSDTFTGSPPLLIAWTGFGGWFDGAMDEIRLTHTNAFNASFIVAPRTQWRMNDTGVTTAVQGRGWYYHPTTGYITGTASTTCDQLTYTPSKTGTACFDFNGSSEYINADVVYTDAASDTTGAISIWFNADIDSVSQRLWTFSDTTSDQNLQGEFRSGAKDLFFSLKTSAGIRWQMTSTANPHLTGKWYNVILVQDGVEPKVYVNGELASFVFNVSTDKTAWFSQGDNWDNGRIACANSQSVGNHSHFNGKMDDFRYYSSNITAAQAADIWNHGRGTENYALNSNTIDVPTSEHGTSGAELLMHLNGDVTDATGQHTPVNVNDVNMGAFELTASSNQVISVDNLATDIASDDKGTVCFWMKPKNTPAGYCFSISTSSTYNIMAFGPSNVGGGNWAPFGFCRSSNGGNHSNWQVNWAGSPLANDGTWHHVAVVQDKYGVVMYVDGVENSSTSSAADTTAWLSDLVGINRGNIGNVEWNGLVEDYYDGSLDDVRYYKTPLTQEAITAIYNEGNGTEDQTTLVPTVFPTKSIGIPELDGNNDVIYKMIVRLADGGETTGYLATRFNEDGGSNCGRQYIYADGVTIGGAASTTASLNNTGVNANQVGMSEWLMYIKRGVTKTIWIDDMYRADATGTGELYMWAFSHDSPYADLHKLYLYAGGAGNFGDNTHIELWRLNL